jgi:hypothetical protein
MLSTCSCQDRCINNGDGKNTSLRPCMTQATAVLPHKPQQDVYNKLKVSSKGSIVKTAARPCCHALNNVANCL